MQSEYRTSCNRHVNSISDLYISDEISILLEEIQSLEPTSYRTEDIQDFEIAGSQTGNTGGGGRTASSVAELETPGDATTINSWDSHANYKHHSSPTQSMFSGVILYFDDTHFKSVIGIMRILLIITAVFSLLSLCTAGTEHLNLFLAPMAGRIRYTIFVNVFTIFITCALLFIDVTHVISLFAFNWNKINAILYTTICVMYLVSASLSILQVMNYELSYKWVPESMRNHFLATGVMGYFCGLESILLALLSRAEDDLYTPVSEEAGSITLEERREVIRYSPSPCPSLQPAVTPH